MLGSVSTSRRANAFAAALDEPSGLSGEAVAERTAAGQAPSAEEAEEPALLSMAAELEALPRPELSADTKVVHRARLIAAMEAAFATGGAGADRVPAQRPRGAHRAAPLGALARLRPRSRLTKGLAAGGLTVGVAAGAFGGVAAASTDALPGDTLYGLKRGMEDIRLDLAGDDADRGRILLDHASTRLNEARRLMELRRAGELADDQVAEVRSALASMHHDASEGRRLLSRAFDADGGIEPLRSLSSFTEKHGATWAQLRSQLPPQLTDVSDDVTGLFDAIEHDLEPLQSLLPADDAGSGSGPPPGGGGSSSAESGGETDASPSATAEPSGAPTPSAPGSPGQASPSEENRDGLIGGGGLLDSGDSGDGAADDDQEAEVTIPPLIDDLLPGLGLDVDDTDSGAG